VCRHIAWLGPPRRLSELLLEPEHGLIVQSYAPRRQAHGRMNAGGWGAGDPGWADVPDHHLVDVADGVVTVTELEA
jgi:hypothetical protein